MTDRIRVELDGKVYVEGVDFSVDRQQGTLKLLLTSDLGVKDSVHRFANKMELTVTKRDKKPKRVAQWKSR